MSEKTSGSVNDFCSPNRDISTGKKGPTDQHELIKNSSSVKERTCTVNRSNSNNRTPFRRLNRVQLTSQKPSNKRRYNTGWYDLKCFPKRLRTNSIVSPRKFLLDKNSNDPRDPLNLKNIANTPASSPVPRIEIPIFTTRENCDPLNLNSGKEIVCKIISSRIRKRKRHRRKKHKNEAESNDKCANLQDHIETPLKGEDKEFETTVVCHVKPIKDDMTLNESAKPTGSSDDKAKEKPKANCKSNRRRWRSKKKNCYDAVQFKPENAKFCYGSNPLHYQCKAHDVRFNFFTKALFSGKDVLDIGCNDGCMSSCISEFYEPRKVVGIDIDPRAISTAQHHILQHLNSSVNRKEKFPAALAFNFGPLYRLSLAMDKSDPTKFPHNVTFVQGNYVLNSDEELQTEQPEYDTVLCLRATKWIHLNFGDDGLKRAFKRMFAQLRCGGQLILEPQPWSAYSRTKNLTETIYNTYNKIELKPEKFVEYLLSKEVGFSSCKVIGRMTNPSRCYLQSLYILTKVANFSPAEEQTHKVKSPVAFSYIESAHSWEEEKDSSCEWGSCTLCDSSSPAFYSSTPRNIDTSCDSCTESQILLDDS